MEKMESPKATNKTIRKITTVSLGLIGAYILVGFIIGFLSNFFYLFALLGVAYIGFRLFRMKNKKQEKPLLKV